MPGQWRDAEAETLHQEALALRSAILGDGHLFTLQTTSNLARKL